MNRPIRLVIILIFVAIVVVGIGFWRNHYLKVINAEPIKVYKDTPFTTGHIIKRYIYQTGISGKNHGKTTKGIT